jgi:hypothetical protein
MSERWTHQLVVVRSPVLAVPGKLSSFPGKGKFLHLLVCHKLDSTIRHPKESKRGTFPEAPNALLGVSVSEAICGGGSLVWWLRHVTQTGEYEEVV